MSTVCSSESGDSFSNECDLGKFEFLSLYYKYYFNVLRKIFGAKKDKITGEL